MASNSVSARPVDDVRAIALTIPSRYVEDFRAAIVSEIRFEAESIV
jgi:hypothetical protein